MEPNTDGETMTWPTTTSIPDISIGVAAGQVRALLGAGALAHGTLVNIGFVGDESMEDRVVAAAALVRAGLVAEPHVAARRLGSSGELDTYLEALRAVGAGARLFVIGGDPRVPHGPFAQALDVLESAVFARYRPGVIGIGGYPDGHPDIETAALDRALDHKAWTLATRGVDGEIITQVTLNAEGVLDWIERLRGRGIELPVRIGVPGPARARAVLGFAAQFGAADGPSAIERYASRAVRSDEVVSADAFLTAIRARLDPERHGAVALHVFALGDAVVTARWVAMHRQRG
jgi:methylenetetrahydrofolate reductase (NADPH)